MQNRLKLNLQSPAATREAGIALGRALPERAICLFFGEMAAGKTTLIKAVCEGLGIAPENVISPTYTLVNIYPGPPAVYHVDLFRLEDAEALLELDPDDWISREGPTLIEWPEVALPLLAGRETLQVRLRTTGPESRELILAGGARYRGVLGAVGEKKPSA